MGKVKINMLSGAVIEKPLITAFKGENGDYIVFDNEISGTMGLPIILISKLEGTHLSKIADKSAEWDATKEMLRQIIAGNAVEYVAAPLEVNASEDFFTQLTLPINSFDLLRNRYNNGSNISAAPSIDLTQPEALNASTIAPADAASQAVQPEQPSVEPAPQVVQPEQPSVEPAPQAVQPEQQPVEPAPQVAQPVQPPVEPAPQVAQPVQPPVEPAPQVVQPEQPPVMQAPQAQIDLSADKEAFLKACENMFDALVAKITGK